MKDKQIYVEKLFSTFVKSSKVELFFEEPDRLSAQDSVLNLSIHPIRFADDIFFNFQTNDIELKKKLKKYEVDYGIFYHYADIVKATCLNTPQSDSIKDNSLLLIGQTHRDKVLFDGNKYLSLLDYLPQLQEIAEKYRTVYYKPHPYAKNSKKMIKILKRHVKNIEVVHNNIYHLLSNDNIKHVVGLNSSVLYEAKYFRKEVSFLYKPTFDCSHNDIGVYGDYFSSAFWSDILDTKDTNISLPFVPSRLRKSLNDFWGYNEISDEIVVKDIVKSKIKYLLSRYIR